jgi:hypothetical protein
MRLIIECLIVGLITSICYILSYNLIYNLNNSTSSNFKYKSIKNKIIICFFCGAIMHYIIKINNLTDIYCRKLCYDNQCFMVCTI